MKTIGLLFVLLFFSTAVSAHNEPDKYVTHCAVISFLDQLEMIDPGICDAIDRGIIEGKSGYEGQRGSLCYKIFTQSSRKETNISVTLIEKGFQYADCRFSFHHGKLKTALIDVAMDDTERYVHLFIKDAKKLSYCRNGIWQFKSFSAELFAEHLQKITPL